MPHTFTAHPDHPAVAYLARLHADLGGQLRANKVAATKLANDMRAVEAVLKLFDPDYSVRAISARRRVVSNPWFKRGTLFRAGLEILRAAPEPMTAPQIAVALMAARGITDATPKQRERIEGAMRSSLETHVGKSVERVGEAIPKRWRLAAG